jgi:hypothetical protein
VTPSRAIAALVALSLAAAPATARAYTQWAAALTLGGGGRLLPEQRREGLVSLGLRADVLFGPRDPFHARVGPFAAAWSDDFESAVVAVGGSVLLPTSTTTPFVLSVGAMYTLTEVERLGLGVLGRVWWGSRSLNYHASYGMSAGLWLEARYTPDAGTVDVIAGIDGDLAFISLPAVLLWNWITR